VTRRSSIRNIRAITPGNFDGDTKCKHRLIPLPGKPKACGSGRSVCGIALELPHANFPFLSCEKKFVIDDNVDDAVGHMEKNRKAGSLLRGVTLNQRLKFSGDKQPTAQEVEEMNHAAHEQCFIANSVKTEVTVETQT